GEHQEDEQQNQPEDDHPPATSPGGDGPGAAASALAGDVGVQRGDARRLGCPRGWDVRALLPVEVANDDLDLAGAGRESRLPEGLVREEAGVAGDGVAPAGGRLE